jgi:hypothetical protein
VEFTLANDAVRDHKQVTALMFLGLSKTSLEQLRSMLLKQVECLLMCARRDRQYLGNTIPHLGLVKCLKECWIKYCIFGLMVASHPVLKAFPVHSNSVRDRSVDEAD